MKDKIHLFSPVSLIFLFVVCAFTPFILHNYLFVPLAIGLLFWTLTIRNVGLLHIKAFSCYFALFVVAILYWGIGISSASIGNYVERFLWLTSLWMALYLWRFRNSAERRLILLLLFGIFIINLIQTAIYINEFPDFNYAAQITDDSFRSRINIGGASIAMTAMFVALFLAIYLKLYLHQLSFIRKLIYISLLIFLSIYIIRWGDSTTTTISYLASLIILQFYNRNNIFSIGLILCILSLVIINYGAIIDFARNNINDRLADRLIAIQHLFTGNTTKDDNDIMARLPMLGYDINAWLESPFSFIFGNGFHANTTGNVMLDMSVNKAGGHSAIFDAIARYGLVGLVLIIVLLKNLRLWFLANVSNRKYALIFFLLLIFTCIFNNPMDNNVLFSIAFLTPYLSGMNSQSNNVNQ